MTITLLILSAFAINLCYIELSQTELQIAGDASSRAACQVLMRTEDPVLARAVALESCGKNAVAGKPSSIDSSGVIFGQSQTNSDMEYEFTPSATPFNSVRVLIKPDSVGMLKLPFDFGMQQNAFTTRKDAVTTQVDLDVVLVLDRSGSMAYSSNETANALVPPAAAPLGWAFGLPVPAPSRWLDLVGATNGFLDIVETRPQRIRTSLVTFSSDTTRETNLNPDSAGIRSRMLEIANAFNGGATNVGGGILAGLQTLDDPSTKRPFASQVMLLLTDGKHNTGTNPNSAANQAKAAGVTIYTISFSNEADVATMKNVAAKTGGKHFAATDSAALSAAFLDIARELPVMLTE